MYVYEGRDYSKETTARDQQAFDNMMAGTRYSNKRHETKYSKKPFSLEDAQAHPPFPTLKLFPRCEEQRKDTHEGDIRAVCD